MVKALARFTGLHPIARNLMVTHFIPSNCDEANFKALRKVAAVAPN